MPQLFTCGDGHLGAASQDPPEPTAETPSALWRLKSMMGSNAPSVVEDSAAADVTAGELDANATDEDGAPDHESVTVDEGTVAASPISEAGTDEMPHAAAPEPAGSNEVVPSDATPGDLPDDAIPTDDVHIAQPADWRDAVAAFRAAVGQAQEEAETQLLAVVELVRKETSEQHAAELAQLTEEADTRQERAVAKARVAAEAESARVCDEMERQYLDDLQRAGNAVVESFEALTVRIQEEA